MIPFDPYYIEIIVCQFVRLLRCQFGQAVIFTVTLYQNHLEFLLIQISGPIIIYHRDLEAQIYI